MAKAIADKIDVGMIGLKVTKKDLEALAPILNKGFNQKPDLVLHIYKVRRGKISRCKLWQYVNLGTCRTEDLFLTNNDYELIDIEGTTIEQILDNNEIDIKDIPDDEETETDDTLVEAETTTETTSEFVF